MDIHSDYIQFENYSKIFLPLIIRLNKFSRENIFFLLAVFATVNH